MIKTYRYRLKDRAAAKHLREKAVGCNQAWNWCVAQQRDTEARYKAGAKPRKWLSAFALAGQLKGVGADLGVHQQTVQNICDQFATGRDKFRRAPKFRSSFGAKRARGWIPFQQQSRRIDGNSIIYLGKTYRWFGNKRRPLPAEAKGGAFVEDALGRWWVTFHVEAADPAQPVGPSVGIDLGLKTLATLSDGTKIDNITPFRTLAGKLATAQRAGNVRRAKAIHAKIANVRKDHLHKITTHLARSHALIAVGDVNSKRLAKTKMAKSVLDAGWSTFRQMLKYKSLEYVEVDEKFTTQTCSGCGSIAGPKGYAGLNERRWDCSHCGESHDRDVNAARNILRLGLSAQAHVDESRRAA
jgi:putative transposase